MTEQYDDLHRARLVDLVLWCIVGALFVTALASSYGILVREVYSPSGLVKAYLTRVADHDLEQALSLPGVAEANADVDPEPSRELLRTDLLGDIDDITIVSDDEFGTGRHQVTATYTIDGHEAVSRFMVEQDEPVARIFPGWKFAETPLGTLRVTVEHATTFDVGDYTLDTRAAPPVGEPGAFQSEGDYFVVAPSTLTLSHDSRLLHSSAETTTVTAADGVTSVHIDAEPKRAFITAVQSTVNHDLEECAKQTVLKPSSCPFGTNVDDRVVSDPAWTITKYPQVSLSAGEDAWGTGDLAGTAHLSVEIQSLWDGSYSTLERDVPFLVRLNPIVIDANGDVHVTYTAP